MATQPTTNLPLSNTKTRGSTIVGDNVAMWWLIPGTGWRWQAYLPVDKCPEGEGKVITGGTDTDESRFGKYRAEAAAKRAAA